MLQGRLFSYSDTHRHRLGVNYQSIPVNCPFATKVLNYQRDGNMRVDDNQKGAPNYFPNSFSGPTPSSHAAWHQEKSSGDVKRYETGDEDNFTQCGQFFRKVLSDEEKDRLTDNIAGHLVNAQEFLQTRAIANFAAADKNYGRLIKEKIEVLKNKQSSDESYQTANPLSPARVVPGKSNL